MPFFSFSINEIKPPLTKFNITSNKVYYSKNSELWNKLNKKNTSYINFLKREKRFHVKKISKNILFCLPPNIGLGDAVEYAMAINKISKKIKFNKLAVAFPGENSFIFKEYFKIDNIYPFIIPKSELSYFDTIFHLTLEIKSLVNQKYLRSNIFEEITKYFNIKKINQTNEVQSKNKINKISIFPISSSPIRTMPINILNELINLLINDYSVEIFLDHNSEISKFLFDNINVKKAIVIDPTNKKDLISLIKNIQYGLFMDSGPLHIAKMFNKRGVLLETSVSNEILLQNYNKIKGIENKFSSAFCNAPCGLTDIFNYNNSFGCYDSLKINKTELINNNLKNMINRGVKNYYLSYIKKPVGCLSSINVQNIYNIIKQDLAI